MKIFHDSLSFSTEGEIDIIDLTARVSEKVAASGVQTGLAHLFVPGATGALTAIEYEPGLIEDFTNMLEALVKNRPGWKHNLSHGDSNAHSHLRASLIGPDISIPVRKGKPKLGTWQQIIFVELDTRNRSREVEITVIGE
ncbi:MAG TPA: secondary thiamine-phosphate synthase enzyme YjbQ [bacterium]|nr:secondary thiamine-phosphate synthase enzyme YjbQ [bacterium]